MLTENKLWILTIFIMSCAFIVLCGWFSKTEYEDMKADSPTDLKMWREDSIIQCDSSCSCDYCTEVDTLSLN